MCLIQFLGSTEKMAAVRAALFRDPRKTREEGRFCPPPSSARVKPCICRVASRVTCDSLAGSVFEGKFGPMIPCAVKAHHMVTLKKCREVQIPYCGGVSHRTSNADSRHVCTRLNFFWLDSIWHRWLEYLDWTRNFPGLRKGTNGTLWG